MGQRQTVTLLALPPRGMKKGINFFSMKAYNDGYLPTKRAIITVGLNTPITASSVTRL